MRAATRGRAAIAAFTLLLVLLAASWTGAEPAGFGPVDAAIVLAADGSASVAPVPAYLQRHGHADALASPEVIAAIRSGARGCIAVTYVEWSGVGQLHTILPWTRLCEADGAAQAAAAIRQVTEWPGKHGRSSLSYAVEAASLLLDRFPGAADREIIDISTNGTNNDGRPVEEARRRVVARGHVINVIALARSELGVTDDLPGYFRDHVIGGPGAFVIAPASSADYVRALRRKLVLEISGLTPAEDDVRNPASPERRTAF